MLFKYRCCFCGTLYDWYDGLYENPKYNFDEEQKALKKGETYGQKRGVFIPANGFVLHRINPIDDRVNAKSAINVEPLGGNLNIYFNICSNCMRKLLDNLHPYDENDIWNSI